MLHQHEGHAGIDGEMVKQLAEGFEAAGGSADADHRERIFPGLPTQGALFFSGRLG
ncbi:MAG TPA: hypothetical protein VF297_21325 [Pyrinomonadaceae bacterium]